MNVRVDAAGDDQQPAGVDFLVPGHRAAELGDPAARDPDVGDLLATRGDDGPAADYEIKTLFSHPSIVAWPGSRYPRGRR